MKIDCSIETWNSSLKNNTFKSGEIFPIVVYISSDCEINLASLSLELNLYNSGKNIIFSNYTNIDFEFQEVNPTYCKCILYLSVDDLKQKLLDKGFELLDIKHLLKYEFVLTTNTNFRKYLVEGQFYIL